MKLRRDPSEGVIFQLPGGGRELTSRFENAFWSISSEFTEFQIVNTYRYNINSNRMVLSPLCGESERLGACKYV